MISVSREQLAILVNVAARRTLTRTEVATLRAGLGTTLRALAQLESDNKQLRAQNADYEQVIRTQRAELLAADSPSPSH